MLALSAQPAQKQVCFVGAVLLILYQQMRQEDGQLVQHKKYAWVMVRTRSHERFALPPPCVVACGAHLRADLEGAQFLEVLLEPAPELCGQARRPSDGVRSLGDVADDVRRRGGILHVHEEKRPPVCPQTPAELSGNARLAHASLASQQDMRAAAHLCVEQPEFGIAIEEVLARHRGASLRLHLKGRLRLRLAKTVGVNNTVVNCLVDNAVVDTPGAGVRCRANKVSSKNCRHGLAQGANLARWHNYCFSEAHERRDRYSRRPASGPRPALGAA